MMKQIMRLPKKGHGYIIIVPSFNNAAVTVKQKVGQTNIRLDQKLLDGYEIVEHADSFFIPRDFRKLSHFRDITYAAAVVPDTGEITHFIRLDGSQYGTVSDVAELLDHDLVQEMGGLFLTYTPQEATRFLEFFPYLSEILLTFYEEVEEANVELYDPSKLEQFLRGWPFN